MIFFADSNFSVDDLFDKLAISNSFINVKKIL